MCNDLKRFFAVILAVMLIAISAQGGGAAGGKAIPIFPDADLQVETCPPGVISQGCSFSVKGKTYEDVVAFYEKYFKTKAMDIEAFAKKYPAKKPWADFAREAVKSMPAGTKEVYFAVEEMQTPAGKDATFLRVSYSPLFAISSTSASIFVEEKYLGPDWPKRKAEILKKKGIQTQTAAQQKKSEEEFLKKMEESENKNRKEELERLKKLPAAKPDDYNLPVYKGSRVANGVHYRNNSCYGISLIAFSPVDKVVSFYKEKLKGKFKISGERKYEEGEYVEIDLEDKQFKMDVHGGEDGFELEVWGKRGNVNRSVKISSSDRILDTDITNVEIKSETPDECANPDSKLIKVIWHDKMPKDQD